MAVTPVTNPTVTRDAPKLGPSGSALWQDLTKGGPLPSLQATLLIEACRIADRLDKLDARLSGEEREWLEIQLPEDGSIAVVIVDRALAEARQQAVALKGIVAELRQAGAGAARKTPVAPKQGGASGSVADLTSRIAARSGSTAGRGSTPGRDFVQPG